MIDHVWTVVCSRAVIDRDSNNISLQNVIEQLEIRSEPRPNTVVPVQLHVATMWARSDFDVPSRGRARLTFLSPSGRLGDLVEFDVDLSEAKRTRTRVNVEGLPVGESGRHTFRIEFQGEGEAKWVQVAAVPLEVTFVPPEVEQAESEPK